MTESTEYHAKFSKWEVTVHMTCLIDGVVFMDRALPQGEMIEETMIPVPEKKGFTFDRWYLDPECRIPAVFPISAWDDVKLYADFNEYGKVTFLLDGEVYHEEEFILDGTDRPVEEPETPMKEGSSFSGWYLDETMKEAVEFPVQVRESMTYYGTMTSTLTGTVFSPAGIIALIAGCAAIIGAVIFLAMKKKKSRG